MAAVPETPRSLAGSSRGRRPPVDANPFVAESGIRHEPYFHDAFAFEQVKLLLPDDAEIVRLHSLYAIPPGLRLVSALPGPVRRAIKRLVGERPSPAPAEDEPLARGTEADEPLPIPPPTKEAAFMIQLSKLMWQVPGLRLAGRHVLIVTRRAGAQ